MSGQPLLSIIVVFFNMRREAPRTLHSISRAYQRRVNDINYEVIAIDNGSTEPLDEKRVTCLDKQFHYFYLKTDSVSPSAAINFAAAKARGRYITVCVDGARLWSPGIIYYTALATRVSSSPLITTLAWHLGDKPQHDAVLDGYNQESEDLLLQRTDWKSDGYRLFDISCLAPSSKHGWFMPFAESSCLTLPRPMFDNLGGFDEGFRSPGGGLANMDFLKRGCELSDSDLIVLLGEGTFHMFHGGVASNAPLTVHPYESFSREYEQLRGERYQVPRKDPLFLGSMPSEALAFLQHSATVALETTPPSAPKSSASQHS